MEFLAHEVLVEAISKLAALSNSKLFLLLEDSSSNRCFAGAESLCADFTSGELVRKKGDAQVYYDVEDRRCVKTASASWATTGRGGGGGGGGGNSDSIGVSQSNSTVDNASNESLFPRENEPRSGSLMGDHLDRNYVLAADRVGRNKVAEISPHTNRPVVVNDGNPVGARGSLQGGLRDGRRDLSEERRRVEETIPALGPDPAPSIDSGQKRGGSKGAESGDREATNKRIKMEPKSRSPSPTESGAREILVLDLSVEL